MTVSEAGVRRARYTASRPDEARAFMDEVYGTRLRVSSAHADRWEITLGQADAGDVALGELDMHVDVTADVAAQDRYVFMRLLRGRVEFDHGDRQARAGVGDFYLAITPTSRSTCRTQQSHTQTVTLPTSVMRDAADSASEPGAGPVTFASYVPVPGGAARWQRTVRFVTGVLDDLDANAAPLVVGPAARLLAATALSVFPNDVVTEPTIEDSRDSHPQTLRRAMAYIQANPDRDISLSDIAGAAYVTPRAVQIAFRRHLDTTPLAYLRKVRLAHAHADLEVAAAGDGTTVTDVAARWGFANMSRFAAAYKAEYGRHPRHTLSGRRG